MVGDGGGGVRGWNGVAGFRGEKRGELLRERWV